MNTCVVGLMFGDEGKGAIVDLISHDFDYVVRYNGGANAGHTVKVDGQTFKYHLLPSGAAKNVPCVLTHGMAIDPVQLVKEIKSASARIFVSDKAHCVMPWHIENDKNTGKAVGTTCKGIGPCYASKMERRNAVRMQNLLTCGLENDEYRAAAEFLQPYLTDTVELLQNAVKEKKNILFESANGMMLDVDFGTYPFVTSSAVGPAAIPQSAGLPNLHLDQIIGVIKCYMTRVGEGPFQTELNNEIGQRIRDIGNEYGTTTGRARRVGWLDLDIVKESAKNSGATEIALMHADVLFGFKSIYYKAGYTIHEMQGWNSVRDETFGQWVDKIQAFLELPINTISLGADRNQKIKIAS